MKRRGHDQPTEVMVAITPMLDMTFQLLFFFILNYHPSALEGQMNFALPVDNAETAPTDPNKPPEKPSEGEPTLKADLTVEVKTQNNGTNGGISQVTVMTRSGPHEIQSRDNPLGELLTYLNETKAQENLSNKEDITLKCDSRLTWESTIKVMDVCRKAGFNVGFGAPLDAGMTH